MSTNCYVRRCKALCLVLCLLPLLLLGARAEGSERPQKIVVAAGNDSAPFYFLNKEGEPEGWMVDLWKVWSEKTGIDVEFRLDSFGNSLDLVRKGEADAHAGCFYSKERDAFMDYVLPLTDVQTHFFYSMKIQGLKSLQNLRGFNIGIIKGDYAMEVLERELPGASISVFDNNKELFEAVENGDVKVFVKDTLIALKTLSDRGLMDEYSYIPEQPLYSKPFLATVREGQEGLAEIVLDGMKQISQQEKMEIEAKWSGKVLAGVSDKLVISCMNDYPPFTTLTKYGEPAGLLVDLWRLWAERTGTDIEFRFGYWYETLDDIAHGRADIHSGLNKNFEREVWMDFTEPIFLTDTSLFYLAGQQPVTLENLKGKKVGTLKGAVTEAWLRENAPSIQTVPFVGNEQMAESLLKGDVAAVLIEGVNFTEVLLQHGWAGKVDRVKKVLSFQNLYAGTIAGRRGLINKINQGFQAISRSEIQELERRWVPEPTLRHFANQPRPLDLTRREMIWLKDHPQMRLGVDSEWPPFEFISPQGLYEGIVSEYISRLGEKLGVEILPVSEKNWDDMVEKVSSQDVDMVAGPNSADDVAAYLHYSKPYLSFPLSILVRDDSSVLNLRDLKGKKVGVVRGYDIENSLNQDTPGIDIVLVDNTEEALWDLVEGKLDALVSSTVSYRYLTSKHGISNVRVAVATPYSFNLSMGVRRDWPELVGILDKALGTITDSERDAIVNHWLNIHIERFIDWSMVWKVAFGIFSVAALILGIIIHANRKLAAEIVVRKRTQAALAESRERLEKQNHELIEAAELREDVERVSRHDLKNPLTNILSVPQLLMMSDNIEEYQKEMLKRVEASGYAMLQMINNSLDIFKMERGAYKFNPIDVDIAAVVRKVLLDQESVSNSKELSMSLLLEGVPMDEHETVMIQGEELLCYSMLSNLVRNAFEASPEGEAVTVELHREDGVALAIHNMGAVPEGIRDYFFEKYATSGKARGTGLGTYSAKLIAEVHGGTMGFITSEEHGTTVTVKFPA
ncbi:transporter substrate-binding domain-containing protein [uncultured Pseudodesulfovibrio sp.]|uniref:transporter substrate-binding domain-containing protein n=1 Tax=uncultured Pseudodesulfovibrio sp. TaxID=2035858 RepID=UPI0029C842D3|nr:transporter substrate-binding domain-containing protein [uncultured Pseudodesulfovibrio sp.]